MVPPTRPRPHTIDFSRGYGYDYSSVIDIGPHTMSPTSTTFADRDDAATLTDEKEERDMERHRLRRARAAGKFFSWCTVDGVGPIIVERDNTPSTSQASSRRASQQSQESREREKEREKEMQRARKEEKRRRRGKRICDSRLKDVFNVDVMSIASYDVRGVREPGTKFAFAVKVIEKIKWVSRFVYGSVSLPKERGVLTSTYLDRPTDQVASHTRASDPGSDHDLNSQSKPSMGSLPMTCPVIILYELRQDG